MIADYLPGDTAPNYFSHCGRVRWRPQWRNLALEGQPESWAAEADRMSYTVWTSAMEGKGLMAAVDVKAQPAKHYFAIPDSVDWALPNIESYVRDFQQIPEEELPHSSISKGIRYSTLEFDSDDFLKTLQHDFIESGGAVVRRRLAMSDDGGDLAVTLADAEKVAEEIEGPGTPDELELRSQQRLYVNALRDDMKDLGLKLDGSDGIDLAHMISFHTQGEVSECVTLDTDEMTILVQPEEGSGRTMVKAMVKAKPGSDLHKLFLVRLSALRSQRPPSGAPGLPQEDDDAIAKIILQKARTVSPTLGEMVLANSDDDGAASKESGTDVAPTAAPLGFTCYSATSWDRMERNQFRYAAVCVPKPGQEAMRASPSERSPKTSFFMADLCGNGQYGFQNAGCASLGVALSFCMSEQCGSCNRTPARSVAPARSVMQIPRQWGKLRRLDGQTDKAPKNGGSTQPGPEADAC